MPRSKNYRARSSPESEETSPRNQDKLREIQFADHLPPRARYGARLRIDFGPHFGRGIDDLIWTVARLLARQLRSGVYEPGTIHARGQAVKMFFDFLVAECGGSVAAPADLRPLHVTWFISWLKKREAADGWSSETTRGRYNGVKAVLRELIREGVVPAARDFFPKAALPHKYERGLRAQPLSDAEQQRLALALKADLSDLHHGRLVLTNSEALVVRFLVVAMRTGANTFPLLEMRRDALGPGLLPGLKTITTWKYRGRKVQTRAARTGDETRQPIPLDAAAIVQKTLAETEPLIADADSEIKDRLWLYRSEAQSSRGVVKCLSFDMLHINVNRMLRRHDVRDDLDRPLSLSISRLRQSLAKRAWRLSDGDAEAVALVLGNTTRVADSDYLAMDDQIRVDAARFLNSEFALSIRRGRDSAAQLPITPTGRCSDTLNGDRAPKDGVNHCDSFIHCLSCPSFAITGEIEDLWRLFSFQSFARSECASLSDLNGGPPKDDDHSVRLIDLYVRVVAFIDEVTQRSFPVKSLTLAKRKTAEGLHPFWSRMIDIQRIRRTAGSPEAA